MFGKRTKREDIVRRELTRWVTVSRVKEMALLHPLIAGTSLESFCYSIIGNNKCDSLKSKRIGKSAAKRPTGMKVQRLASCQDWGRYKRTEMGVAAKRLRYSLIL